MNVLDSGGGGEVDTSVRKLSNPTALQKIPDLFKHEMPYKRVLVSPGNLSRDHFCPSQFIIYPSLPTALHKVRLTHETSCKKPKKAPLLFSSCHLIPFHSYKLSPTALQKLKSIQYTAFCPDTPELSCVHFVPFQL